MGKVLLLGIGVGWSVTTVRLHAGFWDFPGGPVVRDPASTAGEECIRSLVRELDWTCCAAQPGKRDQFPRDGVIWFLPGS